MNKTHQSNFKDMLMLKEKFVINMFVFSSIYNYCYIITGGLFLWINISLKNTSNQK